MTVLDRTWRQSTLSFNFSNLIHLIKATWPNPFLLLFFSLSQCYLLNLNQHHQLRRPTSRMRWKFLITFTYAHQNIMNYHRRQEFLLPPFPSLLILKQLIFFWNFLKFLQINKNLNLIKKCHENLISLKMQAWRYEMMKFITSKV